VIKTMILDANKVLFYIVSRQFIYREIPLNPVCSLYEESYISRVKLKVLFDYRNNSCVKACGPWDDMQLDSTERTLLYSNTYPTRCNITQFIYIWKLLYIFRVVPPPIVRSAYNSIYSIWYLSHRYCYLQF
jgi:hypothetical protein